ncbi:ATP-binding protein [Candidatus Chloroploca sp. M-50]|uniref:ATP-binding protein n=1 Tax=Candidatus Chloroploca mongolica TaxID=2528176 RepID=A0ABS4DFX0_9CHLR|nr:ATP-binding protein [Candidatus Chloroploca mongolica]MBP1468349.1 ATP-binding protein [Candidatus Chloroploca mongolica]
MIVQSSQPIDVLALGLDWLQLRLALLQPPQSAAPAQRTGFFTWSQPTVAASPAPHVDAVRQARAAFESAMQANPQHRLVQIADRLGLEPHERDLFLLCLGHALHSAIARLCAGASGQLYPTFALAQHMSDDSAWDALMPEQQAQTTRLAAASDWLVLAPERPLRAWRLIEISQPTNTPLIAAGLRADEWVVNYIVGANELDDRLALLCLPLDLDADVALLAPSQAALLEASLVQLNQRASRPGPVLARLLGANAAGRRLFAWHIAQSGGLRLYRLPASLIPTVVGDLETFVRLWERQLRLTHQCALLVEASDVSDENVAPVLRLLERIGGVVLVDAGQSLPGLDSALAIAVTAPTVREQRAIWEQVLPPAEHAWAARLAAQFSLNAGEIAMTAEASAGASEAAESIGAHAWQLCRARARTLLDGLVQRIEPKAQLQQLVLPATAQAQIEQIRDQVLHRSTVYDDYGFREAMSYGFGISVLLAGESGTGKTMAAEALAHALDLDLYRIDLSAVVSKYIGETEKNLRRIFDAAEQSGAILLFDEADALFGKRSEVKDSHDRYANIEVSYLLQRMENYDGLAILTTNMKGALDQAFLRRLRFIVDFPFPGKAEREQIWRGAFPAGVHGAQDLDYGKLARPSLTGGQIRNIALNAAFMAAARDGIVTIDLLREATLAEWRKQGRSGSAADLAGWETPARLVLAPVPAESEA